MKKLTRPGRADHFRQDFLRHLWNGVRRLGLAVPRQQQQRTCEPFLGRVEQLVEQIFFDADVPRQHVRQETFREGWVGMKLAHHLSLLNSENGARRHRRRRRHPPRLARKAALAEEMAGLEKGNHSLLSRMRQD
jgi:hypothetical protein